MYLLLKLEYSIAMLGYQRVNGECWLVYVGLLFLVCQGKTIQFG